MKEDFLFKGTSFELFNPIAYIPADEKFILAESHEKGFVFQIICISGHNAGSISGFFKEENDAINQNKKAVSKAHFLSELKRNFGDIDENTVKIYPVN
jgi:hypothetical protein